MAASSTKLGEGWPSVEGFGEVLIDPLTPTELSVLRQVARGLTNRQIAKERGVSIYTVGTHVTSIFLKLRVHSKFEAAKTGWKLGLIPMKYEEEGEASFPWRHSRPAPAQPDAEHPATSSGSR